MSNQAHVLWLWRGHQPCFHRHHRTDPLRSRCGRLMFSDRWRASEGTERQAVRLGLRRCRQCWPAVIAGGGSEPSVLLPDSPDAVTAI